MEIPEQLTLLAELAVVEKKIRGCVQQLESVPAKANEHKAEAEAKKKAFDVIDAERLAIEKAKNENERKLLEARDHLKKWRLRLEKIRDEREHTALLSEIGGQKREIGRLENFVLEQMEQLETLEKSALEKMEAWEASQNLADQEFSKVEGQLNDINGEKAGFEKSRDALSSKLPEKLVTRYQRVAERRKGQGVAIIKGEICQACHTTLPPQLVLMVYKGAAIEACPTCSRVLVHESMTHASASSETAAAEAGA